MPLIWWSDANGSGLLMTANGLAGDLSCCCDDLPCDCSGITESLNVRVVWTEVAISDPFNTCQATEDFGLVMTKQVGSPPDPQPPCTGDLVAWWKYTVPNTNCTGVEYDIELACCNVALTPDARDVHIRVNGGSWFNFPSECECAWEYSASADISDGGACATSGLAGCDPPPGIAAPVVQISCEDTPYPDLP